MPDTAEKTAYLPDLIYTGDRFEPDVALVCSENGRIAELTSASELSGNIVRLNRRAILPGMVNAHSHAFQRVIRGRTEYRSAAEQDNFWSWREMMYSAATRLFPEDIYDASRMAFLEMVLGGITAVGEFHYLHHAVDGKEYDDPNLIAKEVIRAARDVGLRIALLRVAYSRSGYRLEPNEQQKRFIDPLPDTYLRALDRLLADVKSAGDECVLVGTAPHSIRAVPLEYLQEVAAFARNRNLVVHMHVSEQPGENVASLEEHSRTPIELLDSVGALDQRFTAVHAVHIAEPEALLLAQSRATVCACPTTERNLGDGIVPALMLFNAGVHIALGTDSHVQIDLLEDARELEYHLRLQRLERNVLADIGDEPSALAARLFDGATRVGARSLGMSKGGELVPGAVADFFTVDLDDPTIAGAAKDNLLSSIVFSASRATIREVFVSGKQIVSAGFHAHQSDIVERFTSLQRRLWS